MFWSEYAQRFAELVMNWRGMASTVLPPADAGGRLPGARALAEYPLDRWQQAFLQTRSVTIWGGTSQVQRNIVAERVLGLPREPRA
jgi:alkylation response protein AidB-like acyl-CoA dehydrogenase